MNTRRRSTILAHRVRFGACGFVVLLLALGVGVASAASPGKYTGQTSQKRTISFRLSGNQVTGLRFQLNATCPSHHVWKVTALGFPAIKVVNSHFKETFGSSKPSATATIKGTVLAKKVTGSLSMRRFISQEHANCTGSATFTARRTHA